MNSRLVRLARWLAAITVLAGCGGQPLGVETGDNAQQPFSSKTQAIAGAVGVTNGLIPLGVAAPKAGLDWDGDGRAELSVFRPATSEWLFAALNSPDLVATVGSLGAAGDYPVPADYDGDGKLNAAYFRVRNGTWQVAGQTAFVYGQSSDIPVPGDYDGDGRAEPAVFRPLDGSWWRSSFPDSAPILIGQRGDIPVPADYDGDGRMDVAVWHPVTGLWQRHDPATDAIVDLGTLGLPGDVPVPGDYDGDGRAEPALFRGLTGTWIFTHLPDVSWGQSGDVPVPADYDGDGKANPAVYRPTNQTFSVFPLQQPFLFGQAADQPAQAPAQGVLTCDRPLGCTVKSEASWPVLETLVRAHYWGGSVPPYLFRAWIQVAECEAGVPWDDGSIEMGIHSRGFRSPDRGPFQISPIHFFHGTSAEWQVVRAAWTKHADYFNNDIALETDTDVYGFGFTWEQMLDPRTGAEFGVMLAARSQALGKENLGPWYRSLYCHAYKNSLLPVASELVFPRVNDYARFELSGNKYLKTH